MAKKRPDGEGSVSQRKDGRWMARLSVGRDAGGKAHRVAIYGATQAEVVTKLQALRQQRDVNAKSLYGKDTVAAYLQRWLDNDVAVNLADKTHQEYEMSARLYVTPFIGHLKLTKLDGEQLVAWQATLKRNKFTANMRCRSIKVLNAALNKAVKLRLIPFNPCNVLDKPKLSRKEVTPLEPGVCQDLFAACQRHRLGDVMILAAMTGLRNGELFALQLNAVNLVEGVVVVLKTLQDFRGSRLKDPKSKAGKRVI